MKRKVLIFTILFIISFFFTFGTVSAINVKTGFVGGEYSTGISWSEYGEGGSAYKDHMKYVLVNGQKYPAFCIDPGLKLRTGTTYSCSPTNEAGLLSIMESAGDNIFNDQTAYTRIQLTYRFYATMTNMYSGKLVGMKAAVIRFRQVKSNIGEAMMEGCKSVGKNCPNDAYAYLNGNQGLIDQAWNDAVAAFQLTNDTSGSRKESQGSLTFTKTTDEKDLIVYNITSMKDIKKIKFVCDGCTISGPDDSWSGRSGTLTVIPPADCKSFTIKAYYVPEGIYLCTNANTGLTEDYQYLITSFDAAEVDAEIDTSGEPTEKYTDAGAGCNECCTLAPEIEPNYIEGDVSNCCYDSTHSEAKEYELNDLFCLENELQVDHYWKKCKIEPYLDEKMTGDLNEYCTMYCTERVTVDIPGAITATSGRYFDLTTTVQGTKSPYVEGYKRCRTIIDYDSWHHDYMTAVEMEIEQYNLFQEKEAYKLMYDDAINASFSTEETVKVTCTLKTDTASDSCKKETGLKADGTMGYDECSVTATSKSGYANPTKEFIVSYTRYPFTTLAKYPRPWYQVQIDELRENDSTHKHIGVFLENDKKSYETEHGDWSAWDIRDQIKEIENYLNEWNNKEEPGSEATASASDGTCSCYAKTNKSKWECSRNIAEAESRQENVPEVRNSYDSAAQRANDLYNNAADTAKDLEDKIDKCDLYFEKYEGTDAKANYQFNALFNGFEYTQIYLSEYGSLVEDSQIIEFEPAFSDGNCQISGPTLGPDAEDGLVEPQYSDSLHYSTGKEQMEDFKNAKLEWQENREGFAQYRHEMYEADKKFVQDAKYKAVCYWNEPENTKYTLVPRGTVEESSFNATLNNRQYYILLTTLEGTYDTRWLLSNLGTNGKFDMFFAENGATCSAKQNALEDGLFHCGLKVEHEIVYTGKCNGDKTTVSKEECDPTSGPEPVLNFKIADPKNLFPSCSDGSCEYGYNWFEGANGPETLSAVQRDGSNDATYSPSHLSYSITLTPADMRQIKNYNTYRESDGRGGYSDFTLTCSCPEEPEECNEVGGTQTCKRSESCVKCTSVFLTNLYQGRIEYGGTSYSITGGNGNIQTIRDTKIHWSGQ